MTYITTKFDFTYPVIPQNSTVTVMQLKTKYFLNKLTETIKIFQEHNIIFEEV